MKIKKRRGEGKKRRGDRQTDYSLPSEGEDFLPSEEEGQIPESEGYVPEKGALDEFEMEK